MGWTGMEWSMVRCDVVWKWCIQGDVVTDLSGCFHSITPKPSRLGTFGAGRFVTCVYVYVYICVYAYLCVCVHAYAYVCVHVCLCMCVFACMCICVYVFAYVYEDYYEYNQIVF